MSSWAPPSRRTQVIEDTNRRFWGCWGPKNVGPLVAFGVISQGLEARGPTHLWLPHLSTVDYEICQVLGWASPDDCREGCSRCYDAAGHGILGQHRCSFGSRRCRVRQEARGVPEARTGSNVLGGALMLASAKGRTSMNNYVRPSTANYFWTHSKSRCLCRRATRRSR